MMNKWKLPASVNITGVDWQIETNFKVVLDVLGAFNNPEYDKEDKLFYMLMSMIKDFDSLPENQYVEAGNVLSAFIDMGLGDGKKRPTTMDWEQDAVLIIPEINKQLGNGVDVRDTDMHWWTFLGYYMGIGDSPFTHIVSIRQKKATGKKLEKWEQEYLRENRSVVELQKRLTKEEIEQKEHLLKILG